MIDPQVRFDAPKDSSLLDPMLGQINGWINSLFPPGSEPPPENAAPAEVVAMPLYDPPSLPAPQREIVQEPLPPSFPQLPPSAGLPPVAADSRGVPIPARPVPGQGGGIPILREFRLPDGASTGR